MKYNVGDKVRVRGDLKADKMYGSAMFTFLMERFKGNVMEIEEVRSDHYILHGDKFCCLWTDEMLEFVEKGEDKSAHPCDSCKKECTLSEDEFCEDVRIG